VATTSAVSGSDFRPVRYSRLSNSPILKAAKHAKAMTRYLVELFFASVGGAATGSIPGCAFGTPLASPSSTLISISGVGTAPGAGTITTFHPPGGLGVRLDTHVYAGYFVPPYYDSLLAKLIVSGNTREEAIVRARHVLDQFIIEGIPTTIPFLRRIVDDDAFVRGDVDTGFVARMMAESTEAE
ncbi:MAG: hypothetical protein IIC35_09110, partial [Gemmatimonadetes bacterium]|nr:hypothetical protein [Gemmatimonadota bacterium]